MYTCSRKGKHRKVVPSITSQLLRRLHKYDLLLRGLGVMWMSWGLLWLRVYGAHTHTFTHSTSHVKPKPEGNQVKKFLALQNFASHIPNQSSSVIPSPLAIAEACDSRSNAATTAK